MLRVGILEQGGRKRPDKLNTSFHWVTWTDVQLPDRGQRLRATLGKAVVTEPELAAVPHTVGSLASLSHPNRKQRVSGLHRARSPCLMARMGTQGYRRHRDTTGQREASQDPRGPVGASGRNKGQGLDTGRGLPGAMWRRKHARLTT